MKDSHVVLALVVATGALASTMGREPCCFRLTASGGPGGVVGQLTDGQNRIGDGRLPTGTYCIDMQGGSCFVLSSWSSLTDAQGRGCILTPPTSQWQCDAGARPTMGFSIGSGGALEHNGDNEFWACPTGDHGGYNFYSQPLKGEPGCRSIAMIADNCGYNVKTSTFTAPCSTSSMPHSVPSSSSNPPPSLSKHWSTSSESLKSSSTSSKPCTTSSSSTKPCTTSSHVVYTPKTSSVTITPKTWTSSSKPCSPSSSSSKPCTTGSSSSRPCSATSSSSKPCTTSSHVVSRPETSHVSPPPETWTSKSKPVSSSSTAPSPPKTSSNPMPSPESTCPASLPTEFQFPHLLVPVNSQEPSEFYGTVWNGTAHGSISTIFTFDIPQSYEGKTCHLEFYFPHQSQLETSAYTIGGEGVFNFAALDGAVTQATTFANMPSTLWSFGNVHLAPGNAYQLGSSPDGCPAGKSVSFIMSAVGDSSLNYFQDWNPCPIGLWIVPS